jgi:hypothetical protein
VYGPDNHMRLTGLHETQSIDKFNYGIADRGASIRVPHSFVNNGYKGYLEDRRPNSRAIPTRSRAASCRRSRYQKVIGIMEGDELLTKNAPGGNIVFGRDEYYLSFLGAPSAQNPWLIQFGGHHLALNITFVGDKGTLAPSHTAAQPAKFTWEGKTIRPLGAENDLSFELINALDDSQRKQAILGSEFRDLVLGPGQEGKKIVPEGVKVSSFTAKQRALLTDLIQQWVGILNADTAAPRMSEIKSGLGETWFAWSGPTTPGSAAYFRIQGPTVFIEYSPQRLGGDATQHIHTMYRDFSNEFGAKWLKP